MPTPQAYEEALRQAGGRRSEAARILGVSVSCMLRACKTLGLEYVPGRPAPPFPERFCEYCGRLIQPRVKAGPAAHGKRKYCTRSCHHLSQYGQKLDRSPPEGPHVVPCDECGRNVLRSTSAVRQYRRHFCSPECFRRGKAFPCAVCGKDVWRARSQIQSSLTGEFCCSNACSGEWMRRRAAAKRPPEPPRKKRRRYPPEVRQHAMALLAEGVPGAEVARRLGTEPGIILYWRDAPVRQQARPAALQAAVVDEGTNGRLLLTEEFRREQAARVQRGEITQVALSLELGVHPGVIRGWRRALEQRQRDGG